MNKLNQHNQRHGLWKDRPIDLEIHYFNGKQIGHFTIKPSKLFLGYRLGHIINRSLIGYYLSDNNLQFIFKSGKKFGEEIIW